MSCLRTAALGAGLSLAVPAVSLAAPRWGRWRARARA